MDAPRAAGRSASAKILIVVDGLALVLFVLVGLRSHHEGGVPAIFVRNAVPLAVAWFATAWVVGAYRRPGLRTLLLTWIVAVPVALGVRSIWVGSPTGSRLLVFLGVGLAFTLLFLLVGRGIVGLSTGRMFTPDTET